MSTQPESGQNTPQTPQEPSNPDSTPQYEDPQFTQPDGAASPLQPTNAPQPTDAPQPVTPPETEAIPQPTVPAYTYPPSGPAPEPAQQPYSQESYSQQPYSQYSYTTNPDVSPTPATSEKPIGSPYQSAQPSQQLPQPSGNPYQQSGPATHQQSQRTYSQQTYSQQPYQQQSYPRPNAQQQYRQQPYAVQARQAFPPQGGYYPPANPGWNALCIVGFILSFLFSPLGLILSIVALVQINKVPQKGRGLGIAGIVLGALGTVMYVIVIGTVVWAFSNLTYTDDQVCFQDNCSSYSNSDSNKFAYTHKFDALTLTNDTQK